MRKRSKKKLLFDVLSGIDAAAKGGVQGYMAGQKYKADLESQKLKDLLSQEKHNADLESHKINNLLTQAKIDDLKGKEERELKDLNTKHQEEENKKIDDLVNELSEIDKISGLLEDYFTAEKESLRGLNLYGVGNRNILGTESNKYYKKAQNLKQPLIGILANLDKLGKTKEIYKAFSKAEDVKNLDQLEAVKEAVTSQLNDAKAIKIASSGLSNEEAINAYEIHKKNLRQARKHVQGESQTTQEQQLSDVLGEGKSNKYEPTKKKEPTEEEPEKRLIEQNTEPLIENKENQQNSESTSKKTWKDRLISLFDNEIAKENLEKIGKAIDDPEAHKEAQKVVMDTLFGAKLLGDNFGDFNKSRVKGMVSIIPNIAKTVTPNKYHKNINDIAEKFDVLNIKNPDSLASKAGDFLGFSKGLSKVAPTKLAKNKKLLKGSRGVYADGAIAGAIVDPENPIEGAIRGGSTGVGLQKGIQSIATSPQKIGKKFDKYVTKGSRNDIETTKRLASYFPDDSVPIAQIMNNPKLIQEERNLGKIPFSGYGKSVNKQIESLDKVSNNITEKYQKIPHSQLVKEIKEVYENNNKKIKPEYEKAFGKDANDLILEPNDVNNLITNNYRIKPNIKSKTQGERTLNNNELLKTWEKYRETLKNLWEQGNIKEYKNLYKELKLPNFLDIHFFQSDLNKKKTRLKGNPNKDSQTSTGMHNDTITTKEIIEKYSKKTEYKAATKLYNDIVAPFLDSELWTLLEEASSGKEFPNYKFFENNPNKGKVVFNQLSPKSQRSIIANIIDPKAEKLTLRTFRDLDGERGSTIAQKVKQYVSTEELEKINDFENLNRIFTDLQPEQKSPKTGYANSKFLKPATLLGILGSTYAHPALGAASGLGIAMNRKILKKLRNKKNLESYLNPKIRDKKIQETKHKYSQLPLRGREEQKEEEQ